MFDAGLRKWKDRALSPLVAVLSPVHPLVLSVIGLVVGLGSAGAAALGASAVACGLWLVNRLLDGLDGLVARKTGKTSDLGGYLDLVFDFVVYAAIPLGLAWAQAETAVWMACAGLLASYYINAVSWLALSALLEKRGSASPRSTSLAMPVGLVEGFETLVITLVCLIWTQALVWLFAAQAVLVLISAAQRMVWALRGGLR